MDYELLHKLYIEDKKTSREIAKELGVSQSPILRKLKEYGLTPEMQLNSYSINKSQHDLIIGSILGDASFGGGVNKYIEFSHAEYQKDYLINKFQIMKDICKCEDVTIKKSKGARQDIYRFTTRQLPVLNQYYQMSLNELIDNINENSFTIWLGDDGDLRGKSYRLAMARFNIDEMNYIQESLINKFNLNSSIAKDKTQKYGHHGLYFNINESIKISSIIKSSSFYELFQNSLNYKLT
ncbi:putative DNA endonuclease [Bacillus phage PBC2]|uniref:Putative DNA endonuclease n=1 Tax=Bacillus phage PBC2 TaxID=1675029 RepID=A0A218KC37_9CAUD|nr:putative DNA endonuclease [Bacillus phage PBC2]AKQ08454.1 putative DNA endonuclease [Bacillus phage PBC2]